MASQTHPICVNDPGSADTLALQRPIDEHLTNATGTHTELPGGLGDIHHRHIRTPPISEVLRDRPLSDASRDVSAETIASTRRCAPIPVWRVTVESLGLWLVPELCHDMAHRRVVDRSGHTDLDIGFHCLAFARASTIAAPTNWRA